MIPYLGIWASSKDTSGGGTPEGTAHRYWRIRFMENWSQNSTSSISGRRVEIREIPGGTDIADDATITADSELSGSYPVENLRDGTLTNFWISANTNATRGDHWIKFDFGVGVTKAINQIKWTSRDDSFGVDEAPMVFDVQWSDDDTNWTTSWISTTQSTWTSSGDVRTFTRPTSTPSTTARYWMLECIDNNSSRSTPAFSGADFEFRSSIGGGDETGSGTVFAPNDNAKLSNTFNGNVSNFWYTSNVGGRHYIGYDLGSSNDAEIVEVEYTNRPPTFGQNESICEANLLYSHDTGDIKNWFRHAKLTARKDWSTSQETRVFHWESLTEHTDDANLLALWKPVELTNSTTTITGWTDSTANNHDFTIAGNPTQIAESGKNIGIEFDGTDDIIYTSAAIMKPAAGSACIMVFEDVPSGTDDVVVGEHSSTDTDVLYDVMTQAGADVGVFYRNDTATNLRKTDGVGSAEFDRTINKQILTWMDKGPGGGFLIRLDGEIAHFGSITDSGTITPDNFSIGGAHRTTNGLFTAMKVYKALITDDIDFDNIQFHEAIMAEEYGITTLEELEVDWDNATYSSANITSTASTKTITKTGTGTEHIFLPVASGLASTCQLQGWTTSVGSSAAEMKAQFADDVAGTNPTTLKGAPTTGTSIQNVAGWGIELGTWTDELGIRIQITTEVMTLTDVRVFV